MNGTFVIIHINYLNTYNIAMLDIAVRTIKTLIFLKY